MTSCEIGYESLADYTINYNEYNTPQARIRVKQLTRGGANLVMK
jgi:hypothetical protein